MSLSDEHKKKLADGRKAYQEKRRAEKEAARLVAEQEYKNSEEPKERVFKRRPAEQAPDAEILSFPPERSIEVVVKATIAQLKAAEKLLAASRRLLESLAGETNTEDEAASG